MRVVGRNHVVCVEQLRNSADTGSNTWLAERHSFDEGTRRGVLAGGQYKEVRGLHGLQHFVAAQVPRERSNIAYMKAFCPLFQLRSIPAVPDYIELYRDVSGGYECDSIN